MEFARFLRAAALIPFVLAVVPAQDVKSAEGEPATAGIGPGDAPADRIPSHPGARPTSDSILRAIRLDRVLYDVGEGKLWAVGNDYKMAFDAEGASFIPKLGQLAPTNTPVTFRLARATIGGVPIALDDAVPATRDRDRIRYSRGDITEAYDLRLDGAEQSFVLERPLGGGDCVLHVQATTSLAGRAESGGISFDGPYGSVRYGAATAIDARGGLRSLAMELADGEIRILVPGDFLEHAQWPVVVDPLVTTGTSVGGSDLFNPDVAFEPAAGMFGVVAETAFSATDHDVLAWLLYSTGATLLGASTVIEAGVSNWSHPKVGAKNLGAQLLIVAEVGLAPSRQIWGRTMFTSIPTNPGTPFQISANEGGDKVNPVVGGDPSSAPPTYYCVAWQRIFSATDDDIHVRIITEAGTPHTAVIAVSNGSERDQVPAISKSDGNGPASGQAWNLVWQREMSGHHDIVMKQVSWNGSTVSPLISVATTGSDTVNPTVTGFTDVALGAPRFLVAFEVTGATRRIGLALMQGQSYVIGTSDISGVEGVPALDRRHPAVTCTGGRFVLTYAEQTYAGSTNYDVFATTIDSLGASAYSIPEGHVPVIFGALQSDDLPNVASRFDGGIRSVETLIVGQRGTATHDLGSAHYDGMGTIGGFTTVATGCGGLGITATGTPALGQPVSFLLSAAQTNPIIVLGLPLAPTTLCSSCKLGVDLVNNPIVIPGVALAGFIPPDGGLVGVTLAVQGADATGSCGYRVTPTVRVAIR